MKKHSFLLISFIWIIAAVFNFYDDASLATVLYNVFAAIAFVSLYIFQLIFEKRGERGKMILKGICICYIAILCIILFFALAYGIYKFL